MKLLVVFALVAAAAAAPQSQQQQLQPQQAQQQRTSRQSPQQQEIQLLRYNYDNSGDGNYNFGYEQSNGQKQEEQGEIKNQGSEGEYLSVRGSYSWVDPNGVTYIVTYVADDKGFQPTIEQGPGGGVPPGVLASLVG